VKSPTSPNPAQRTKSEKQGRESDVTGSLFRKQEKVPPLGAELKVKYYGIKSRSQDIKKSFQALSADKRKLITNRLGNIDGIISRGLISITDTDDALHLEYIRTSARPPQKLILKYTMDGNRITKADTSSASEHVSSHVRTDALPKRQASRVNKAQFNFWLDPEFKRSMLAVKIQDPARSLESIYAEAFNDLFRKYDVPTVPNTEGPAVGKPRRPNRSPGG
jgi:hypothetical protein